MRTEKENAAKRLENIQPPEQPTEKDRPQEREDRDPPNPSCRMYLKTRRETTIHAAPEDG